MDTTDFNKHDINNFINDTWQKYVGDSSELQVDLKFAFDQWESKVNLHKRISSPQLPWQYEEIQSNLYIKGTWKCALYIQVKNICYYSLIGKMRLSYIFSDFFYIEVTFKGRFDCIKTWFSFILSTLWSILFNSVSIHLWNVRFCCDHL